MKKYKLFCIVTMKSYFVEAECEYRAIKKLALQLGVPLSCIDVYRDHGFGILKKGKENEID